MSCADFESLIALNVTGDLAAREAAQVQAHLNECDSCRALAEELSSDLQWLQSAHREPADHAALHQVRVSVMRQLESEQSRWNRPFGGLTALGWRWQWVAVSAVAILLGGVAWWTRPSEQPTTTVAADAPGVETQPHAANSLAELADTVALPAPGKEKAVPEPDRTINQPPETDPSTSLARSEQATGSASGVLAQGGEQLESERQFEVVTAALPESQEVPSEAVMLKIPTSNPGIIVYWLMDDENQVAEDNKGD